MTSMLSGISTASNYNDGHEYYDTYQAPEPVPAAASAKSSSPTKSKSWFSSKKDLSQPIVSNNSAPVDPAVAKKQKRKSLIGTKTKVAGATVAVVGGAAVVASAAATVATAGAVAAAGGLVAGGVWLRGKAKGSSKKNKN